jgi:thioredoxin reductase (NADPH)
MNVNHTPLLIIGAGPAGYTAAIYVARAGVKSVLFTGAHIGGQLIQTMEIENYPGFSEPIGGPELMEQMRAQTVNLGVPMVLESIVRIDASRRPFVCYGEKTQICADAIIIATGAMAKWLNVKGEDTYRGHGVSACATCDGFFYRGKNVAVVGGGNTAVIDALFLERYANSVTVIHRRDSLRAEKILQDRLMSSPKIKIMWNAEVKEVCGNGKALTHVKVYNTVKNVEEQLVIDGLFVAVGHAPQSEVFKNIVKITETGYIETLAGTTKTSTPGIFAAGDVMEPRHQQAIVAAGRGCIAAMEAVDFLMQSK